LLLNIEASEIQRGDIELLPGSLHEKLLVTLLDLLDLLGAETGHVEVQSDHELLLAGGADVEGAEVSGAGHRVKRLVRRLEQVLLENLGGLLGHLADVQTLVHREHGAVAARVRVHPETGCRLLRRSVQTWTIQNKVSFQNYKKFMQNFQTAISQLP
jgi:hypothetical protein